MEFSLYCHEFDVSLIWGHSVHFFLPNSFLFDFDDFNNDMSVVV